MIAIMATMIRVIDASFAVEGWGVGDAVTDGLAVSD